MKDKLINSLKYFYEKYSIHLILIFAFILRFRGINFGLPYLYNPDEHDIMDPPIHMLLTGDLNPHWFGHPGSFIMYLFLILFSFIFFFSFLFGYIHSLNEFQQLFVNDPTLFYYIGRLLMVCFAIITIYVVYLIAEKLFNKSIGLLASFLLTISPLHVQYSRYIRTDITSTMLIIVSLYFLLKFIFDYQKKSKTKLHISSLLTGFSIATRYTSGIAIFPILIHCLIIDNKQKYLLIYEKQIRYLLTAFGILLILIGVFIDFSWLKAIGDSYAADGNCDPCEKLINVAYLFFAASGIILILIAFYFINLFNLKTNLSKTLIVIFIGFFIFAPFVLLDPFHSINDILYENSKVMIGSERLPGIQSHIWYLKTALQGGIGGLFFEIFAGVGLFLIIYKKSYEKNLFLIFPILFFIAVGNMKQIIDRWLIPLLPFEAIFFGVGFYHIYIYFINNKILQNLKPRFFLIYNKSIFFLFTVMLIAASISPIIKDIDAGTKLSKLDTRTIGKDWIEKNLPGGSKIAYEYYSPHLYINSTNTFILIDKGWDKIVSEPLSYYENQSVDYIIIVDSFKRKYYKEPDKYAKEISRYEELKNEAELIKIFENKENPGPIIEIYKLRKPYFH